MRATGWAVAPLDAGWTGAVFVDTADLPFPCHLDFADGVTHQISVDKPEDASV
jgi:hypothetical protein